MAFLCHMFQLRAQEMGSVNDVLRLSFCAKHLENKVLSLKLCVVCWIS